MPLASPATRAVGRRYHPRKIWWPEVVTPVAQDDTLELAFFMHGLSDATIHAFTTGTLELGLYADGAQILLLFRLDDLFRWSDAPFSLHLAERAGRVVAPRPSAQRHPVQLTLVGAELGVVQAIRQVSVSARWWRAWTEAVEAQRQVPFSTRRYDTGLRRVYSAHPSAVQLVAQARVRETAKPGPVHVATPGVPGARPAQPKRSHLT